MSPITNSFGNFCLLIGDYKSMFIMMSPAPKNALPIKVSTIVAYVKFKREPKGTPLTNTSGRNQLKDIWNCPIKADGAWKTFKAPVILSAAIHVLHVENNLEGSYHEVCKDCKEEGTNGCDVHLGSPRLRSTGNPTKHKDYLHCKKKYTKANGYEEKGASQLLPSDIRALRQSLLSSPNVLGGLQMYVIILIGIRNFLRYDNLCNIKADDFLINLHEITEFGIDGLGIEVFGKADNNWVKLMIWSDNDCPELCPIRHLLVYLYLAGAKEGYLFPSEEELHNPPENGEYTTTTPYRNFLRQLQRMGRDVLALSKDLNIGAATFRKTGYLFGVFGGGKFEDLMDSARHKSIVNAKKYCKDAQSLYERHLATGNHDNEVGKFRASRVESVRNTERVSTERLKRILGGPP